MHRSNDDSSIVYKQSWSLLLLVKSGQIVFTRNFSVKSWKSCLEWKYFVSLNGEGGFSGQSRVEYMLSVGAALLIFECNSDLCCWLIGTEEHSLKKEDVWMASAVRTVESTPWATANIIFGDCSPLRKSLMQSTLSPVSNDVIKSHTSFSVSRDDILDQKLKVRATPAGCSNGILKGAELESSMLLTVAMLWSISSIDSSQSRCTPMQSVNDRSRGQHISAVERETYQSASGE